MSEEVAPKKIWSPTVGILSEEETRARFPKKSGWAFDGVPLEYYHAHDLREILIGIFKAVEAANGERICSLHCSEAYSDSSPPSLPKS